jgi:ABC-2 type transport system permease protein
MNKFFIVLGHTFVSNLKSKSFIITTIVTALLVGIVFSLPSIIGFFDNDEIRIIGVIDQSKEVFEPLNQVIQSNTSNQLELVFIENEKEAKHKVDTESLYGYLLIHTVDSGSVSATYKGMKVNHSSLISQLEQGLNQIQFRLKAAELGLSEQQAAQLFEPIGLEKVALDENAKSEEELVQSTVIVYLLLFAIYFAVLMFGNIVAMEVVKEKSSRVMEILVSSVNPIAQMFGKILGVALLGIFQFSVYMTIGFITLQFGNKSVEIGDMSVDFSNIPVSTVLAICNDCCHARFLSQSN